MHIFLTILAVLGWILLGLLGLFLLLLVMPVRLLVRWDKDGLRIKLKVLFIPYTLLPQKEKKQAPHNKPKPKPQEEKPQKPEKEKMKMSFDKIVSLVSVAKSAAAIALKGIWIRNIELTVPVHCDDAAQTAIAYGKMQAYLAGAIATLENAVHLYFRKVKFIPDFQDEYGDAQSFYCKVVASPVIMVVAGIYVFKRLSDEKIL